MRPVSSEWLERFRKGDLRALSRLISVAENQDPALCPLMAQLYCATAGARVVGITGPPGAGKSTLTNAFVTHLRREGKRVAVIAVDPVSPFSGGALLGDRIRLVEHFNDPGVFIRSLSTRGKLGGLSLATRQVVQLASSFGFDYVLIETVGVGQSEVDVRNLVDVTLVILVPEWGDGIQTLKAGVLEIGDIFVVNKADREGAERIASELKTMLHIAQRDDTPVLLTQHRDAASLEALFRTVEAFFDAHAELLKSRRAAAVPETIREGLEAIVLAAARDWVAQSVGTAENPYEFLTRFLARNPLKSLFSNPS